MDAATADTLRVLMRHAEAALGPVDGPCCSPEIEPCIACVPPDDVPYEPTPEDEAWYRGLCRDHDARLLSERMAADEDEAYRAMERDRDDARLAAGVFAALKVEGFQEMLAAFANAFADHGRADVRWVGVKIGGLYDQARLLLEAKSGEQFDERLACHLDGIEAAHAAF